MALGDSFADIELNPYKFVAHGDRLKTLSEGGDVFPVTVELDLVDYCNHKCGWCVDPSHGDHRLERRFVSELLRELRSLGVAGIVYKGGGEPTLYDDFAEILEETRQLGFEVGVVTNGSRLLELGEPVVEHASYLRVSLDGPTHTSHRAIHQSDDFGRIVDGVAGAVHLRKEQSRRHPIIGLSFAMDHSTIELVGDAVRLGDRLGVDYVLLRPPFFEEVGRPSSMTIADKCTVLAAFDREKRSYSGAMRVLVDYWVSDTEAGAIPVGAVSPRRGQCLREGANGIEHVTGRCLASPLLAVVAADKRVYPCCNLRFLEDWSVGTLDYESGVTFERLWHGDKRKKIMERIHATECIRYCTHPMSRYNEVIEYLRGPKYHSSFV